MHASSAEKRAREGANFQEANDKMFERNYFGMMMVETGEADAFVTGLYTKYSNTIKVAKEVIGIQPGYKHFGTMHILNSKKGTYFIADTLINRHPDTDTLIDIAKLSATGCTFLQPGTGNGHAVLTPTSVPMQKEVRQRYTKPSTSCIRNTRIWLLTVKCR